MHNRAKNLLPSLEAFQCNYIMPITICIYSFYFCNGSHTTSQHDPRSSDVSTIPPMPGLLPSTESSYSTHSEEQSKNWLKKIWIERKLYLGAKSHSLLLPRFSLTTGDKEILSERNQSRNDLTPLPKTASGKSVMKTPWGMKKKRKQTWRGQTHTANERDVAMSFPGLCHHVFAEVGDINCICRGRIFPLTFTHKPTLILKIYNQQETM